jgi:hypothetical protein
MKFLFTVNHIFNDTGTHTNRYSHGFVIYELPLTDVLRGISLFSSSTSLFVYQNWSTKFHIYFLYLQPPLFVFFLAAFSLIYVPTNVRLSHLVLGLPTALFLGHFNYGSFLRRSTRCHDFSAIQRLLVKLNPGLPWQKLHLTRRRRRILLPANWT